MKRCEFLIDPQYHQAVADAIRGSNASFSDFVRQAVMEKLGRHRVMGQLEKTRDEVDDLLKQLRVEVGRARKDLIEDNQRGIELIREDIGRSMRKNEEMNKTFLVMLAGHGDQKPKRPPGRNDEAPMRIPG